MALSAVLNFILELRREQTGNFIPNFSQSSSIQEQSVINIDNSALCQISLDIAANGTESVNLANFNLTHPKLIFIKSSRPVAVTWSGTSFTGTLVLLDTGTAAPVGSPVSPTISIANNGTAKALVSVVVLGYSTEV